MVAALVAVAVGACGSQSSSQKIAAYIRAVNPVERRLLTPYRTVSSAGSRFIANEKLLSQNAPVARSEQLTIEQQLRGARTRIAAVARRLAAVPAPAAGRPLRARLLALANGEIAMTDEVRSLVGFLPSFTRALAPVPAATATLQRILSARVPADASAAGVSAALATKAAALLRYRATLTRALHALAPLRPPAVSVPEYRAQLSSLAALRRAAVDLAHALTHAQGAIPRALERFDQAAARSDSTAVQRANIAAIRAYDRRVTALAELDAELRNDTAQAADGG